MVYVLGIDGGGTKTKGVISTSKGHKLAEVQVGPTNPNTVEQNILKQEIKGLMSQLYKKLGEEEFNKVKQIFAGISGAGHPTSRKKLTDFIKENVPQHINVQVDHDAMIALYSGTIGQPGIVQISGTGSVTYGVNTEGVRDRVGGWGHLLGERGSGYSIGHDALIHIFQAYDRMSEQTCLKEKVLHHFNVQSPPELVHHIYHAHNMKETVAKMTEYVMEAADDGDQVATSIIYDNGVSVGKHIVCLIQKLFADEHRNKKIPIVLTGGVFKRFDLLKIPIEAVLNEAGMKYEFINPAIEPVGGAVIAALRKLNVNVSQNFTNEFNK